MVGTGVPKRAIVDAGASLEAHLALRRRVDGGAHDPAVLIRLEAARSALSFDNIRYATPERLDVIASAGIELRCGMCESEAERVLGARRQSYHHPVNAIVFTTHPRYGRMEVAFRLSVDRCITDVSDKVAPLS